MGLREDLLRKIERKQAEMADAERQWERLRAGTEAYIQALQDTIKVLPRDSSEVKPEHILRAGGALARVRDLILLHGKPQHASDILRALGKPIEKKSRASLTSALGAYVRRGEIFVRTAPNTFGLIELGHTATSEEEPPSGFGKPRPTSLIPPKSDDDPPDDVQDDGTANIDDEEDVSF
jgi:hypothetical protein